VEILVEGGNVLVEADGEFLGEAPVRFGVMEKGLKVLVALAIEQNSQFCQDLLLTKTGTRYICTYDFRNHHIGSFKT